ncbi:Gfo/Idh/MocA family protein [Phycisphaerales bacterium AB-hyl4]|uniref:Gfo/Idh/MocA family protein n=1 Tax=Natronomicrosphaera hydrolytica TaxID=3242702 RepID=A0ABV4U511_9BACT
MKDSADTVVLGIAGVGGYAASMTDFVLEVGEQLRPTIRLAAVCDPQPEAHVERVEQLRASGIQVLESFEKLLELDEIDAVWLPVPIDLHKTFTEKALAAGKAVLCEKPASGTIDELDAMIAARDRAGRPAVIGFQDVYDPTTLPLKRRLLAGEIGKINRVVVHGCWPRPASYFDRATWAGRLKRGDNWVLDSPVQNAMSHFVNIALFLLGASEATAATPVSVDAELYRAAPIENYDTVSARVDLEEGPQLLVLLTHSCAGTVHPNLRIEGERGTVVWTTRDINIDSPLGQTEIERDGSMRRRMLQRFARLVRGMADQDIGVATLEVARQHTLLINALSEATPIHPVPKANITATEKKDSVVQAVPGIEDAFCHCAANHLMLHESGQLAFTQPARRFDLRGYNHFAGPHPDNADQTVASGKQSNGDA